MKIIQAHNFYQYSGGEDTVVANEKELLEDNGHDIIPFYKDNDLLKGSLKEKVKLIKNTNWSKSTFDEIDVLLQKTKPDVCHIHNFLPLISPSIYDACIKNNVPIVQTLHNYRLICTNGLFYRKGGVCEDCLGKSPMGAVLKRCYRNSIPQTFIVANMLQKHNNQKTWSIKVDRFICLTDFAKEKFVQHGLPESKFMVKPNFVPYQQPIEKKEDYLIYVGRLEKEKGVELLFETAASINIPIKVVGEGSLSKQLSQFSNIELIGKKNHSEALDFIANARALLFPSTLYEGMPMTILEAFSLKTPVIASDIGAMRSIIKHQKNGLLFKNNSTNDLIEAVKFIFDNEKKIKEISNSAFEEFKLKYSKEANYEVLISLYQELVDSKNEGVKNGALR